MTFDDNPFDLEISGDVHYRAGMRDWVAVPVEEGDNYELHWDGELIAWVMRDDTKPHAYRIIVPHLPDDDASGWRDSRDALRHAVDIALCDYPDDICAMAKEAVG
jgi:hypothetical protein